MEYTGRILIRIFIGLSSFQIIAMFRRGLFYGFLSIYLRNYLGLTVTETTLFATIPMVLNVASQSFVWGPLSDKLQLRRSFIIFGELLAALGTILVWYFHFISSDKHTAGWAIILGLTVVEIFWSMSNTGWSAYISDVYAAQKRSAIQGNLQSIGGFGNILGVFFGGFLYNGFNQHYNGWGFQQGILFFISAAAMIVSILPISLIPEGGIQPAASESSGPPLPGVPDHTPALKGYGFIFVLFLIAMAFVNFGRNSIVVINSQYLTLDSGFHMSSQTLSHVLNVYSAAMILTGFFLGRIKINKRDEIMLMAGTLSAIMSLGLYFFATKSIWIYGANILGGFSEVIIFANSYTIASILIPPRSRARLFGYFNATFFLSWGLAGTLISGPLVDALITSGKSQIFAYKISYVVASTITAIGLVLLMALFFIVIPRLKNGHALTPK
jgi:MFS family permease